MGILKSKVDVIIPVCHGDKKLFKLLECLAMQTVLPEKVVLLNVETGWKEDSCEELQNQIYISENISCLEKSFLFPWILFLSKRKILTKVLSEMPAQSALPAHFSYS